ncbi:MAG: Mannosyl-glycoprotein endo-beta-N-acetylglucosamidase [Ferruginibacter sp.]|nr:Mannosyl-glycoprotein endo-beta-N-acetylglucosamidase [Ferruginibacter sp.]
MIKKIFQLAIFLGVLTLSLNAQTLTPEQYIALYKDIAIKEMRRMGVPAAITLAQGLLETESGNSELLRKSNNHFGIKCKSNWTAAGVSHDDDAAGECFRTYKNAEESYRDHSNFLRGGERYAFLFDLDPTDYKAWARGLKTAGYATNPKYPNILIRHIEQFNLQQYSLAGAADVPKFERSKYKDDPVVFDKNETMQKDPEPAEKTLSGSLANLDSKDDGSTAAANSGDNTSFINGSKCIYAKKGTSLLAIASRFNVNLHKLLDINELEEDGILEQDQLIFLQKKSRNGEKDFVIVQKKETLYDVAQKNGIQLQSLLDYNQLNEDGDVFPGTRLYLKAVARPIQAKMIINEPANNKGKTVLHQVQPREGLYAVAKKYNVTVQQLKQWNNLASEDLKIGQQLIVGK